MSRGDTGGGPPRSTNDHSAFVGQTNEMAYTMKLIDKSWHWEDKAMDVRNIYNISLVCSGDA